MIDLEPHPIAVVSTLGPVVVETISDETLPPGEPIRVSVTSPLAAPSADPSVELRFVVSESDAQVWRTLVEIAGTPTAPVRGRVTGTRERAYVIGRDAQGNPQVRVRVTDEGAFAIDVPPSVVEWYAAVDPAHASALVPFFPGSPQDLLLDISPAGDVHVRVTDADTNQPLTARLLFHGVDGSVDPNFAPDYRASGAGPIIDALWGEVTTPLPSGRYRIAATEGIEWSIDAQVVDVISGHTVQVPLVLRHVVPTPGTLGCDLHGHARPSFDSPVTPEDRVLSLTAAGIDFAVPTEHNVVGNYSGAIEMVHLGKEFISVPGVEVTTYNFGFGHFGVFPFPPNAPVRPYRHTNMAAIFRAARTDPNRYFQLNHPRLSGGIGHFNNIGFDPQGPRSLVQNRVDFDGLELYNGFDIQQPERMDRVLRDYWALLDYGWRDTATGSSDSHRIQYQWAGYPRTPRTMVTVDPKAALASASGLVDPLEVVASLKAGHATVTSGPIIEFLLDGAHPGDEAVTTQDVVHGHLRIRAAPWIDVAKRRHRGRANQWRVDGGGGIRSRSPSDDGRTRPGTPRGERGGRDTTGSMGRPRRSDGARHRLRSRLRQVS